ncbi:hypothetical protein FOL47_002057, partial [Perkinsus chesapeaki]
MPSPITTPKRRPGRIGRGRGWACDKRSILRALKTVQEQRGVRVDDTEFTILKSLPPSQLIEVAKRWVLLIRSGQGYSPLGLTIHRDRLHKVRPVAAHLGERYAAWFDSNGKRCDVARRRTLRVGNSERPEKDSRQGLVRGRPKKTAGRRKVQGEANEGPKRSAVPLNEKKRCSPAEGSSQDMANSQDDHEWLPDLRFLATPGSGAMLEKT